MEFFLIAGRYNCVSPHCKPMMCVYTRIYPTAKHAIIVQSQDISCIVGIILERQMYNDLDSATFAYARCEHMHAVHRAVRLHERQ